jgi:hypothetical protein
MGFVTFIRVVMGTYMELMAVREFVFNLSLGLLEQTK